jgi:branched-chain amino acid transport system substrate-binding protein
MKITKLFTLLATLWIISIWVAPSVNAQPIVLGVPSARAFPEGKTTEEATILAVEEINAQGGVLVGNVRRPLKVEIMDTRDLEAGVPVTEALLVVERLILDKGAHFIVGGPIRTEAYNAAMDLFNKHKRISIVNTGVYSPGTAQRIAQNYDKYKYCFRMTGHVGIEILMELPEILKMLQEKHKFDKAFIMVQDVAHARAGGEIAAKKFPEWGWKVVGHEIFPTGATDFSLMLSKSKKEKAEFIWLWADMPETTILINQWYDLKVPALIAGYFRPSQDPGFWEMTKGKCAYLVPTVLNAGNVPTKVTPWAARYVEAYMKRWKTEPSGYSTASAYMTVYVLKDAIERAGTLDTDAVLAALEKTDLKGGVYGRVRFDPKSHDIIRKLDPDEGALGCWFQWQDGKRVAIFPPKVAVGTLKLPPWLTQ